MGSFEVNGERTRFYFGTSVLGESLKEVLGVYVFPCVNLKRLSYALSGTPDIIQNQYTDKTRRTKMVFGIQNFPGGFPERFHGLAIPLTIATNKSDTVKEMRVVLQDNGGCPDPLMALQIRFDEHSPWHTLNNSEGISGIVKFVKSLN